MLTICKITNTPPLKVHHKYCLKPITIHVEHIMYNNYKLIKQEEQR